jgi:putative copper export protein
MNPVLSHILAAALGAGCLLPVLLRASRGQPETPARRLSRARQHLHAIGMTTSIREAQKLSRKVLAILDGAG